MLNGRHHTEPSSPFQHMAERGHVSLPLEILALDDDRRKVESIIATGALDKFPSEERIRIGWSIVRQTNEMGN